MNQIDTINTLTNWLKNQCVDMGMKGFIIDATENKLQAILAYLLCQKTGIDTCIIEEENSLMIPSIKDKDRFEISSYIARHATEHKLLVVSAYNKYDLDIIRPWPRFCLIADVFPFGNMTKDEIEKMYVAFADLEKSYNIESNDISPFCEGVKPTYTEIDWAYNLSKRQVKYKDILTFDGDPAKHQFWFALNSRQKRVVSFLHEHIRLTNNKLIQKPRF